jgi:hypothetical protein
VIRVLGIAALALALLGAGSAEALTLDRVGDFEQPTYVTSDPSDANRLLVAERNGRIKLVAGGAVSTFADFSASIACPAECPSQRGLMSIALAPDFALTGRLFVDYASNVDGNVHIDELVSPGPAHTTASFARNLATIAYPATAEHFGAQLQFGKDGFLYASSGDGGGADDPFHNAQNPASLLGKILRLNPAGGAPEVWSLGLRNPFRFSFDRLSGAMIIGDVGQGHREEVDLAPSPAPGVTGGQGANYGWNCREGGIAGPATDPQCATPPAGGYTNPVFEYETYSPDPDLGGSRCSIIGGYVSHAASLPSLEGRYVYSDYCSGVLRSLQLPAGGGGQASGDCSLGLKVTSPVSFGEDASGRLYVVEQAGGVSRLGGQAPAGCSVPVAATALTPTTIRIKAQRRWVERGRRALLTVYVSPCKNRKGERVGLLRNGRASGTKPLSRACTARFTPQIRRGAKFTAFTRQRGEYAAAQSRRLKIKILHRRHHQR